MKPADFTIVADTREPPETVWRFGDLPVVRKKLDSGDYSVVGLEDQVAIERKTSADLVSTLTYGRARFEAELDRLAAFKRALIVVEGDLGDIIDWKYRSQVSPAALVGSFGSFWARWGISTAFVGNRRNAEILARVFLTKAAKHLLPKTETAA